MTDGRQVVTDRLPAGMLPGGRFREWEPHPVEYAVCDVDGTLVGPSTVAAVEVVDAIDRAHDSGIRVGFATGRMGDAVRSLELQLRATGPHILHNGAEVRAGAETVACWTLTRFQVTELLELARSQPDCYLEIYPASGVLASSLDQRARSHWELLGGPPAPLADSPDAVDGVRKVTFAAFSPTAARDITRQLAATGMEFGQAESPLTPGLHFINVTAAGADKGHALTHAARHLDLGTRNVAAIGDAGNDLPMLRVAGTAIAMGQSAPEIRSAAHLVVPDVDAHGVAVAFDAMVAARHRA